MYKGFTFLEVLLALFLLVLVSTLALPAAAGLQQLAYKCELDGATAKLAGDIRLLQQQARQQGEEHIYLLMFFPGQSQGKYNMCDGMEILRREELPHVRITNSTGAALRFQRSGAPVAQEWHIGLQHLRSGRCKSITILPVTGRVLVKEGQR